jgi:membrane protein
MSCTTVNLLRDTARHWVKHHVLQLSAALAYCSIFSIAPLLVVVIALAGWFFGPDAVRGDLNNELRGSMGQTAAATIQSMVQSAYRPGQGTWATALALVTLVIGASGVFAQLKDALNAIFNAPPRAGSTIIALLQDRLLSVAMVLVIGFLMLTSLLLSTAAAAVWTFISAWLPLSTLLLSTAGVALSALVTATLFALIFKWLSDAPVTWRHAWIGAAFTSILFEIGKMLLALYLGRMSAASTYGAAGAVVLILLWVYYASAIVLTGACFTQAVRDHSSAAPTLPPPASKPAWSPPEALE